MLDRPLKMRSSGLVGRDVLGRYREVDRNAEQIQRPAQRGVVDVGQDAKLVETREVAKALDRVRERRPCRHRGGKSLGVIPVFIPAECSFDVAPGATQDVRVKQRRPRLLMLGLMEGKAGDDEIERGR